MFSTVWVLGGIIPTYERRKGTNSSTFSSAQERGEVFAILGVRNFHVPLEVWEMVFLHFFGDAIDDNMTSFYMGVPPPAVARKPSLIIENRNPNGHRLHVELNEHPSHVCGLWRRFSQSIVDAFDPDFFV